MAVIRSFKAVRPNEKVAHLVASVPYDVVNREEAAGLTKGKSIASIFKTIASLTHGVVAITDGARGAYLWTPIVTFRAEKFGKPAINSTGAGDAFGSALTAGIAKGLTPKDSLRLAMMNSGLVVAKMGAKHGLLDVMPSPAVLMKVKVRKF